MSINEERNMNIEIYESADKTVSVEVRTDENTVWLNRQQIAVLFGRDVKTIGKHINNAMREELADIPTVANFATVQNEGTRQVKRQIDHYNLDMILSVGFRVKSSEGIHFRRWANAVLRQHLIDGYSVNQKRLAHIKKVVEIIARSEMPELTGVSAILERFTTGLRLLDDYDHQSLTKPKGMTSAWALEYAEARGFVDSMRFSEDSALFGQEKDESFKSALGAIYQTFAGNEVYPSIQEKAANLLYFVVKNHAFIDGNKRIAAALFVYFLDRNDALTDGSGRQLISNSALAAITLMIALSKPEEKDMMCLLVMNMLC